MQGNRLMPIATYTALRDVSDASEDTKKVVDRSFVERTATGQYGSGAAGHPMRLQSFIPGTGLVAVERLLKQAQRSVGTAAPE